MDFHQPKRMVRVAVVGSLNLDLVVRVAQLPRPGQTVSGSSLQEIPGGKGANQAVAAARLGAEVRIIGRVGEDAYGTQLLDALVRDRIDVTCVQRTHGSSGLAIISVEDSGENSIIVVPGANGLLTPEDVQRAAEAIRTADVLLLQLEVPLETVAAAAQLARQCGVSVLLDPAPAVRFDRLDLSCVDVLCPNETELATLAASSTVPQTEADVIAAAKTLMERGPSRVVISRGGSGGTVVWKGEQGIAWVSTPALPVQVVDTTAAGDAFRAAFAVAFAEGREAEESLAFACTAGSLAASGAGAQPSLPLRSAVAAAMLSGANSSNPNLSS